MVGWATADHLRYEDFLAEGTGRRPGVEHEDDGLTPDGAGDIGLDEDWARLVAEGETQRTSTKSSGNVPRDRIA